MILIDKVTIEGNISRINGNQTNKYIWFDICKNEKYTDNDGEMHEVASFFSAKVDANAIDQEMFKVGAWIVIEGIPKSYIDKDNVRKFYIHVLQIFEAKNYIEKLKENKFKTSPNHSSANKDGVDLWFDKKYESEPMSEKELKEMEGLLSEFK